MTEDNNNPAQERPRNIRTGTYLAILAFMVGWMAVLGFTRLIRHPGTGAHTAFSSRHGVTNNITAVNHPIAPEQHAISNSDIKMAAAPPPTGTEQGSVSETGEQDITRQLFKKNIDTLRMLSKR
ncbi:MAG: hypothetical protein WC299_04690 [Kiritimatiellia bacterium]